MRAGVARRSDDPATGSPVRDRSAIPTHLITTAASLAHERTLPVDETLQSVLPAGALRRGSNIAVHGTGATSFALGLVGEAVRSGSFLAVVADQSFSLGACIDFDIPLRRVVQVNLAKGSQGGSKQRSQVIAALVDGFDVVVVADRQPTRAREARQLISRTRERGAVLLRVGGPPWAEAADLRFDVGEPRWHGLGEGHGHLQSRQVAVKVAGRRIGAGRTHQLLIPAAKGGIAAVTDPVATPVTPLPVTPLRPVAAVETEGSTGDGQRWAGADIDAFLDAAERLAEEDAASKHRAGGAA